MRGVPMLAAPPPTSVSVGAGELIPVGFLWPLQQRLQGWNRVGLNRRMGATLDCESQGTIERWELVRSQPLGLTFPETHPGHPYPAFDFVIERHRVPPEVQPGWQCLQPCSRLVVYQLRGVE